MKFIEIDGKRYVWRSIVNLRRQQLEAFRKAHQPALFELKEDHQPATERTAASRYLEPSLFSGGSS
jgi:hypothetical protein